MAQLRIERFAGRGDAHHGIGMTADVLGAGVDDDVDAVLQRFEVQGVAQVLSIIVSTPRPRATPAIAGTSWTSKVSEPGDSRKITLVFGRTRRSMSAPISGS